MFLSFFIRFIERYQGSVLLLFLIFKTAFSKKNQVEFVLECQQNTNIFYTVEKSRKK
jgi:hypothetical protein